MADTLSTVSQLSIQRDVLITRALRIVGAIGQGESIGGASTGSGAEALRALHDLVAEFQTDGMPLWKLTGMIITYTATNIYTVGLGQTLNITAPLKIVQAYNRSTGVTYPQDTPLIIVPHNDYGFIGQKTSLGQPNQLFYQTPTQIAQAAINAGVAEPVGSVIVYPSPDAFTIANRQLICIGQFPFQSFNTATDVPDFPNYWNNAIVWGLAKDLCYEYGVGPTATAMIAKRAAEAKENALSFGTEEGSLFLRPTAHYESPNGSNTN